MSSILTYVETRDLSLYPKLKEKVGRYRHMRKPPKIRSFRICRKNIFSNNHVVDMSSITIPVTIWSSKRYQTSCMNQLLVLIHRLSRLWNVKQESISGEIEAASNTFFIRVVNKVQSILLSPGLEFFWTLRISLCSQFRVEKLQELNGKTSTVVIHHVNSLWAVIGPAFTTIEWI